MYQKKKRHLLLCGAWVLKSVLLLSLLLLLLFSTTSWSGSFKKETAKTALLVTQTGKADNKSEEAVIARLEKMGFKVTIVEDDCIYKYKPENFTIIIVSSTTDSADVVWHTEFLVTETPVLTWEAMTWDDFGLTDSPDNESFYSKSIKVVDKIKHPIIEGLKGEVNIFKNYKAAIHGCWYAYKDVTVLATMDDGSPVLICVDKGQKVNGKEMPGRRVGFPSWDEGFGDATDISWKLFENSVKWLIESK